ncbi:MAG TPA: glycerophosphodiester phosphodiesterase family protein [Bdellovibrionota bacterium]|jgi:glycerophosphoryl diester phosphodiesterase|nr:glycerophosphodiester phosphodiesterase family protein [Bdellovibrionota bacterium]
MQWICGSLLTLSFAFFSAELGANGISRGSNFEVHGHRGARAREPENTLPAFAHALRGGANVLELDLGVSSDGHLVLNHDFEVNTSFCRPTNARLMRRTFPLVHSLTLAQLKTYNCGATFVEAFPKRQLYPNAQIQIVSFDEFLTWLNGVDRAVGLNIETKIEAASPEKTLSPRAFVDLIVKSLRRNRIAPERVILQSFDFRTIVYAKERYPEYRTSALFEGKTLDVASVRAETCVDRHRPETCANYLSPDAGLLDRAKVREAHELGMKVVPWTLNKSWHWSHFIQMGVDGIITDDPAALVKHLRSKTRNNGISRP